MTERDLLVDVLKRLNPLPIPYMLTGSMASNFWGIPRTTHDLDFVVAALPKHAEMLRDAFQGDFHLELHAIQSAFREPYQFNAIDLRSALKVDFWMLKQDDFEMEMFRRKLQVVLFGEKAWISTAEDTFLHKLYWNKITPSERQIGDAVGIFEIQRARLDFEYLRVRGCQLGVVGELEEILAGRKKTKST
jgi:hypothetical protein